jgi:hypothetical protein
VLGPANPDSLVILSDAKNLVPRVPSLLLYNVKSICICEILHFVQNDRVEVARQVQTMSLLT